MEATPDDFCHAGAGAGFVACTRLAVARCRKLSQSEELPGEFTTFDFLEGIPAPFNFGLSILLNQKRGKSVAKRGKHRPPELAVAIYPEEDADPAGEAADGAGALANAGGGSEVHRPPR